MPHSNRKYIETLPLPLTNKEKKGRYNNASGEFSDNQETFEKHLSDKGIYQGEWRNSISTFPKGAIGWLSKTDNSSCLATWAGLDNNGNVHWLTTSLSNTLKTVVGYHMESLDKFLNRFE